MDGLQGFSPVTRQEPLHMSDIKNLHVRATRNGIRRAAKDSLQYVQVECRAGWFDRTIRGRKTVVKTVAIDMQKLSREVQKFFDYDDPIISQTGDVQIRAILDKVHEQRVSNTVSMDIKKFVPLRRHLASKDNPKNFVKIDVVEIVNGLPELIPMYASVARLRDFLEVDSRSLATVVRNKTISGLLRKTYKQRIRNAVPAGIRAVVPCHRKLPSGANPVDYVNIDVQQVGGRGLEVEPVYVNKDTLEAFLGTFEREGRKDNPTLQPRITQMLIERASSALPKGIANLLSHRLGRLQYPERSRDFIKLDMCKTYRGTEQFVPVHFEISALVEFLDVDEETIKSMSKPELLSRLKAQYQNSLDYAIPAGVQDCFSSDFSWSPFYSDVPNVNVEMVRVENGEKQLISVEMQRAELEIFVGDASRVQEALERGTIQNLLLETFEQRMAAALPKEIGAFLSLRPKGFFDTSLPGNVVLDVQTIIDGIPQFKEMVVRDDDLASKLNVDISVIQRASKSQLQEMINDHFESSIRMKLAVPEGLLERNPIFIEGVPPNEHEYISFDVLRMQEGEPVLVSMYTTEQELAGYLGLEVGAVNEVIAYRGINELIIRAKMIPEEHISTMAVESHWTATQKRTLAIFTDIILDNPDIAQQEVTSYFTASEGQLRYDWTSRIVTLGAATHLGEGAFGEVSAIYVEALGTHLSEQIEGTSRVEGLVAAKIPRSIREITQRTREKILEEAAVAKKMKGRPYIAKTYLCRTQDEVPVIMTERCDAGELYGAKDILAKMPLADQMRIFCQILIGIQGIHEEGYHHRDIKEQNVLLTKVDGRYEPRIIDFGLSKEVGTSDSFGGSPLYIPPEAWDYPYDISGHDAFSAGVMAMVTFLKMPVPWIDKVDRFVNLGEVLVVMRASHPRLARQIDAQKKIPREIREAIKLLIDIDPMKRDIPAAIALMEQGIAHLESKP